MKMLKPMVLNNAVIDAGKVSLIGKIDTRVFAHINKRIFFFEIIVDSNNFKIESETSEEINSLRDSLIREVAFPDGLES